MLCQVQCPFWNWSLHTVHYSAISSPFLSCTHGQKEGETSITSLKRGKWVGIVNITGVLSSASVFYVITASFNAPCLISFVPCLISFEDSLANSTVVFLIPVLSMVSLVLQSPTVPQVPTPGVKWHVLGSEEELSHGDANPQRWEGWTDEGGDSLRGPAWVTRVYEQGV